MMTKMPNSVDGGKIFAGFLTFLSGCVIMFLGGLLAHDKLVEWGVFDKLSGGAQSTSDLGLFPKPELPKEKPPAPPSQNDGTLKPSLESN